MLLDTATRPAQKHKYVIISIFGHLLFGDHIIAATNSVAKSWCTQLGGVEYTMTALLHGDDFTQLGIIKPFS